MLKEKEELEMILTKETLFVLVARATSVTQLSTLTLRINIKVKTLPMIKSPFLGGKDPRYQLIEMMQIAIMISILVLLMKR